MAAGPRVRRLAADSMLAASPRTTAGTAADAFVEHNSFSPAAAHASSPDDITPGTFARPFAGRLSVSFPEG